MKRKKLSVLLLTLVLSLCSFPIGVFAAPTTVTTGSKADIIVENATENDKLAAYKIVDITYDAGTQTLAYAWDTDFASYFLTKNLTVEQFAELTDDSDDMKDALAGLPQYIQTNSIGYESEQTVDTNGSATFENLAMGEYFIRPTSSTSVYQLMLQKVEPTVENNSYVLDDATLTAKKQEVTITKVADKTSVSKKNKVVYTVTVDIPTYSATATNKEFSISDKFPEGLTLDTSSIKVQINGADVDSAAYTLDTTATDDYTFKISVSDTQYTASWSANGGKQLVITYSATLNDSASVNNVEKNVATFKYSNYPYVTGTNVEQKKEADVSIKTYAIKIDKCDASNNSTKLSGAKFDLYRTATQAEIDAGTAVDIPQTSPAVKGIKLEEGITTDNDGVALFEKYEANGTNFDYYIVETQAPSGYNLLTEAVKVNFTASDVEDTQGIYTVTVTNRSGFRLPITGGDGIMLFTVVGIAFMGGAVLLFIVSRRKSKATTKK